MNKVILCFGLLHEDVEIELEHIPRLNEFIHISAFSSSKRDIAYEVTQVLYYKDFTVLNLKIEP